MAHLALASRLDIRTPEGVTFAMPLAGIPSRFAAWFIDTLVYFTAVSLVSMALQWLDLAMPSIAAAIQMLLLFALGLVYSIAFEWLWRGQTPGKRILRLRVVDVQGLSLQFSQVAVRNLLRPLDLLPGGYGLGLLAALLSAHNQRLGDLAANTVVVSVPRIEEPDVDQVVAGKYNSFREYSHLEARLRQRVTPEETGLLLQALLRREALDAPARVALYAELAAHFRRHAAFPEPATRGLTDEQYLRNVADSLFRRLRDT